MIVSIPMPALKVYLNKVCQCRTHACVTPDSSREFSDAALLRCVLGPGTECVGKAGVSVDAVSSSLALQPPGEQMPVSSGALGYRAVCILPPAPVSITLKSYAGSEPRAPCNNLGMQLSGIRVGLTRHV